MVPESTEVISIAASEFCDRFLKPNNFLPLCKACENFGKKWSCPPFEAESDFSKGAFKIFLTKIPTDSITLPSANLNGELKKLTDSYRLILDNHLLSIEKNIPSSRAYFAGSCANCPIADCTRPYNKECSRPEFMRTSLEAHGFDICAITKELFGVELTWSSDNTPPKFLHLVSAIHIQ